jgi:hypothetical protein
LGTASWELRGCRPIRKPGRRRILCSGSTRGAEQRCSLHGRGSCASNSRTRGSPRFRNLLRRIVAPRWGVTVRPSPTEVLPGPVRRAVAVVPGASCRRAGFGSSWASGIGVPQPAAHQLSWPAVRRSGRYARTALTFCARAAFGRCGRGGTRCAMSRCQPREYRTSAMLESPSPVRRPRRYVEAALERLLSNLPC